MAKNFSSGEEAKNRFSRWLSWRHLGFLKGTILAIFDLQVTLMLPTKFKVNKPFGSGEIFKMAAMAANLDFQSE